MSGFKIVLFYCRIQLHELPSLAFESFDVIDIFVYWLLNWLFCILDKCS